MEAEKNIIAGEFVNIEILNLTPKNSLHAATFAIK